MRLRFSTSREGAWERLDCLDLLPVHLAAMGDSDKTASIVQSKEYTAADHENFSQLVREECDAIAQLLVSKNKAYGNSALEPVRLFSKASPVEQIKVRLDDKLSRLAFGHAAGEDVEKDLLGYLILLRVARRMTQEDVE